MTWAANTNLLVVDDDVHIRRAIVLRLGAAGYCVLQAADADEAMRILEVRDDIDLICSDIEMPGSIDGFDLAAVVHARWPLIKIVLMSGHTRLHDDDIPARSKFVAKTKGVDAIIAAVAQMMLQDPRLPLLSRRSTRRSAKRIVAPAPFAAPTDRQRA